MTNGLTSIIVLAAVALMSFAAHESFAADLKPSLDEAQAAMKTIGVELKVTDRPPFPRPTAQSVEVVLTPLTWRTGNTICSFGLPFPPGMMADDSKISVEDATGKEIPVFTKPLVKWWIDRKEGTIRSVLVQFEINLPDKKKTPQKVTVRWDKGRTKSRPQQVPVDRTQDVMPVNPGDAKAFFDFRQPKVLATLPAQWLCDSLIVWQQVPAEQSKIAPWFDEHFDKQFPGSLKWITIGRDGSESYLFDRAAAYTKAYVRSGKPEYLLGALQAVDYYIQHVSYSGLFVFAGDDLKYVLAEGPTLAYMLTGDERYPAVVSQMTKAWQRHTGIEYHGTGFWTERHTAYGLMAYLHSYELTGNQADLDHAKRFFDAVLEMQVHPGDGKEPAGAWLHTARSHGDGNGWTTSPWMSAFLTDAIWKYWMNSGDPRCPASLLMYAKYTQRYTIGPEGNMTWYMANAPGRGTSVHVPSPPRDTDVDHNIEGIYLLSMGNYLSGGADTTYLTPVATLYPPIIAQSANEPGMARKFNWEFRETSMLIWFLMHTPGVTSPGATGPTGAAAAR